MEMKIEMCSDTALVGCFLAIALGASTFCGALAYQSKYKSLVEAKQVELQIKQVELQIAIYKGNTK